jgi:predicted CXXCH cytochrome family protein
MARSMTALAAFLYAAVMLGVAGGHPLTARHAQESTGPSHTTPTSSGPPSPSGGIPPVWWLETGDTREYIGSAACQRCHADEYRQWHESFHVQMTKPVSEARILGDFSRDSRLAQHGRGYSMETRDGRYFISVSHRGRPAERFEVHYALGARRVQGYLSKLADGRIYVLPVFWHQAQQRWFDWKEITPVPDTDEDLRQIWNINCFNCHATNLSKNFDLATRTYGTAWSEMGVGCEACHGPGRAHASLMESWERDPAARPLYDLRRTNHALSRELKIFAARAAERRQVFDLCAYCHGNKNNLSAGFVPGDRYEDYALPFLVSQPVPADDPQGEYWPDGRPSRFNRPQALMQSGCFLRGGATCVNCHAPHGSAHPASLKSPIEQSDGLCLQCHGKEIPRGSSPDLGPSVVEQNTGTRAARRFDAKTIEAHTFHAMDSAGSRCINCHMSEVNWRLLMRRRDHTFKPPVPELTATLGIPNACNTCHDDKTPEWTMTHMDRWYGDRERRAREVGQATAFYDAADGNAGALKPLASIVVNRARSPIARASAAEFIGQLVLRVAGRQPGIDARRSQGQTSFENDAPADVISVAPNVTGLTSASPPAPGKTADTPAAIPAGLINALIAAASDPEPAVRAHAVRALGFAGDRKAVPPLVARLADKVRAVRVAGAEGLLNLGIAQLPGGAGAALVRAQDEYGASLTTFGDRPRDHLVLGWLELQRNRHAPATRALNDALALDPEQLQSPLLLGVIAAREGRYAEAIDHWERVKAREPTWPNIDLLIDEAKRRREP